MESSYRALGTFSNTSMTVASGVSITWRHGAAAGADVGVRNAGDGGLGRLLATEEGKAEDSERGCAHSGLQEGGKRLIEGRAGDTALGDDGGDVAGGSHVESRVEHVHALRGDPRAGQVRDSRGRALLDGDLAPVR